MSLLLSPHDDDSALFASGVCLRERPTVVIVTDSWVQPLRGEIGCSASERAEESRRAHAVLGCPVVRLGLRDDCLRDAEEIVTAVRHALALSPETIVYAPALEGGHYQHDLAARAARMLVPAAQVRSYHTYARPIGGGPANLYPVGTTEVVLTPEEQATKVAALRCYESQVRINLPHFLAVRDRSEWLSC